LFIVGFSNGSVEKIIMYGNTVFQKTFIYKKTPIHKHNSAVTKITTENDYYATASKDGTVIVSTATSGEKQIILPSPDPILTMQFNPTNKNELLTATTKNVVTLWNFSNPDKVFKKFEITLTASLISVLLTKKIIIIASEGKSISLFNTETGLLMGSLNYKGNISSIVINKEQTLLLASFSKGAVVLYDLDKMFTYYATLAQKTFEKKLQKKSEQPSMFTVERVSPLETLYSYLPKGSALIQKFSLQ